MNERIHVTDQRRERPLVSLSAEEKQCHMQKVGAYIQRLVDKGKINDAQPLEVEGIKISGNGKAFMYGPFNESKEVITGYYLIMAKSLQEAAAIAKADPRFEEGNWKMAIRPIMKVEGIN